MQAAQELIDAELTMATTHKHALTPEVDIGSKDLFLKRSRIEMALALATTSVVETVAMTTAATKMVMANALTSATVPLVPVGGGDPIDFALLPCKAEI
jgi:hypothetical protein